METIQQQQHSHDSEHTAPVAATMNYGKLLNRKAHSETVKNDQIYDDLLGILGGHCRAHSTMTTAARLSGAFSRQ